MAWQLAGKNQPFHFGEAVIRHLAKRVLANFGLQLVRMPSLEHFLTSRDIDLVIDVGANVGQFARALRGAGYQGKIISFEPTTDAFLILAEIASQDTKWQVHKLAVGAAPGKATINVSENSVFSSITSLTTYGKAFDLSAKVVKQETVDVITLDGFVKLEDGARMFLKIDTQGFEQQVLMGAQRLLINCFGVLLELPVMHLYEGVWRFEEAVHFMRTNGFLLSQVRPVSTLKDDSASAVELDCVFRRA